MIKKSILVLLGLYATLLVGFYEHERYRAAHPFEMAGQAVTLQLQRGPFTVYRFRPASAARGVIVFASGDGGWYLWEERVGRGLRDAGYDVTGVDSAAYASADYDLAILQNDYSIMARAALAAYGAKPPPLIIGGFSMGAAQAIAVMGGPHPPENVAGLLLASPLSRGRYGLQERDKMNILPTGPGTFAVDDFAAGIGRLPVVQWHAEYDPFDSRAWLKDLAGEHRECDYPGAGHDYDMAPPNFVRQFVASAGWLLHPDAGTDTLGRQ